MVSRRYLQIAGGLPPDQAAAAHPSTLARARAYALALPLPVMLWMGTGFLLARTLLQAGTATGLAFAALSGFTIFLIERVIMAVAGDWRLVLARVGLGVLAATIGSGLLDTCLFERDIGQELRQDRARQVDQRYAVLLQDETRKVAALKAEWLAAQAHADCEADGSCGTKHRTPGPVYRILQAQADQERVDYQRAEAARAGLLKEREQAIAAAQSSHAALEEAGVLARIDALARFVSAHPPALLAWRILFLFVLLVELLVLSVKLCFGETPDEKLNRLRESLALDRATRYVDAQRV